MPFDRQAAIQLGLLLLVLPAQYLITTYFGATNLQKEHQLKQIIHTVSFYTNEYLSWEKWGRWCLELVDNVRVQLLQRQRQDYVTTDEGESPAVEVIKYRHPEGYFASSTKARVPRPVHVKYHVGQVVRHKKFGYRGVIIGWDAVAQAPDEWLQKAYPQSKMKFRHMPNYLVLVDIRDRPDKQTTYVAEENLEPLQRTLVMHPKVDEYFDGFDGFQYLPRSRLKTIYPHG
jgi:hemimethylated DNA binding protein